MAFFSRPQSASAAIKIVAPPPDDPTRATLKKDSTPQLCRNVMIYGTCKYQDKGCLYQHPPRPSTPPTAAAPQPETPSARLSQAVNAPVFVPKSSSLPPTSPTPSRAQAQTPLTASTLSTSPPATEHDEYDPYDPQNYFHTENGEIVYNAENPYVMDGMASQIQGIDLNPYEGHDSQYQDAQYDPNMDYYQAHSSFIRQPLNHHLYTLPPPSPPPSHFVSETLRTDLQLRSETLRTACAPGLNLPDELSGYHTLVPLESTTEDRRKFGNWHSTVYRATGKDDRGYALRRIENYRLAHQAAFSAIEQWSRIQHPNIVQVHEAFTSRSFGDNSLVVAYTYHPNAQTLYDAHMKPRSPTFQNGRLQAVSYQPIPERTMWSYIIQIAGAMKAVHDKGLAVRMIDVTKVLLTGKNRIRISSCGVADVLTYIPPTSSTPQPNGAANAADVNPRMQQDDLSMFGKLIFALCCNDPLAIHDLSAALETMKKHYSTDLRNVALFCLSRPGLHKHISQLFDMIGSRLLTEMDDLQNGMDRLEGELMSELENARLVRLLSKFGFINERPEFARDARWSETGDRYIIKLFRDYVFHQVDEHGHPVVNLSHVLACLNKLDAGTDERIMLVSRDEQSLLVVSYKDIKACVESAFAELSHR